MHAATPSPTAPSTATESWRFLRKFLRDPQQIASIWPSSRHLARWMVDGITVSPGDAILELGPGTGPFTTAIDALLRGTQGVQYLGIERDPEFVELLRRKHPQRELVLADAGDLGVELALRPWLRPVAVISGLPLVSMPIPTVDRLLDAVLHALPTGGHFRTFSYLHTVVNPASWRLRRTLAERFGELRVTGPVLRNLPPALVFAARKTKA